MRGAARQPLPILLFHRADILKRAIRIRPLAMMALAMAITALPVHSEIIDRIAASVGNRVITASDLDRQIRVAAFSDGVKADFSPKHKKAIVNAMIEQKLVESELANSRYPLPDPAELIPAI